MHFFFGKRVTMGTVYTCDLLLYWQCTLWPTNYSRIIYNIFTFIADIQQTDRWGGGSSSLCPDVFSVRATGPKTAVLRLHARPYDHLRRTLCSAHGRDRYTSTSAYTTIYTWYRRWPVERDVYQSVIYLTYFSCLLFPPDTDAYRARVCVSVWV